MIKLLDDLMPHFDVMRDCLRREDIKCGRAPGSPTTAPVRSESATKDGSPSAGAACPDQSGSGTIWNLLSADGSVLGFRIGDRVEIDGQTGNVTYAHNDWVHVQLDDMLVYSFRVRDVSHAEKDPQPDDGWQEDKSVASRNVWRVWRRQPSTRIAFLFADGHWEGSGPEKYACWHDLKIAIEGADTRI